MSGAATGTRYASVVLDVDSTLTRVEGIEWLAERRGTTVAQSVAEMTQRAMDGTISLDAVYGARLALVQPARPDMAALAGAYAAGVVPGARSAIVSLPAGLGNRLDERVRQSRHSR